MERETGFEPATSTLARLHSTAELFPRVLSFIIQTRPVCQDGKGAVKRLRPRYVQCMTQWVMAKTTGSS